MYNHAWDFFFIKMVIPIDFRFIIFYFMKQELILNQIVTSKPKEDQT